MLVHAIFKTPETYLFFFMQMRDLTFCKVFQNTSERDRRNNIHANDRRRVV